MKIILKLLLLCLMVQGCYTETAIPVQASFSVTITQQQAGEPTQVTIQNTSTGADTYQWFFEGGLPSQSNKANPGVVLYTTPGTYIIQLIVTNAEGEQHQTEQTLVVSQGATVSFTQQVVHNNYPPVTVNFTNTSQAQSQAIYTWFFTNGTPATYQGHTPPEVVFNTPGTHQVVLELKQGEQKFVAIDSVKVANTMELAFTWELGPTNFNLEAPLQVQLLNNTQQAISYEWQFPGGHPTSSSQQNPTVIYSQPGTYTIQLTASNGKQTQTLEKQLQVAPNTGIQVIENVKLGIYSAHQNNTQGAFYATSLRKSYTANQITPEVAPLIDIVFLGQNEQFTYNKFISPAQAASYNLVGIGNYAQQTTFINNQQLCNCGLNVGVANFESISNQTFFTDLIIPQSVAAQEAFSGGSPHIVLFQTQNGKKGAIKIKEYVALGAQSYIVCDIKVEK